MCAPADSETLFALDLATGRELWQSKRGTGKDDIGNPFVVVGVQGQPIDREIETLGQAGFEPIGLGPWILKVENAAIALEIMGFALLAALGFYALSRRTALRMALFERESAELRALNARLQREISER